MYKHSNAVKTMFSSELGRKIYETAESTVISENMAELIESGVLVGFSGGADSVLLLCFLREYIRRSGKSIPLLAVHVNHGIRGEEADRDECFSMEFAKQLGVEVTSVFIDVPTMSASSGLGIEEAARNARYSVFVDLINGRNDICVMGKKFSGTAQCIENGRVLHHGTLLYDADLSKLSGVLKVNSEKLKDKGIRSVESRVTNLKGITNCTFTPTEFMEYIAESYAGEFDGEVSKEYVNPEKMDAVMKLVREKYLLFEWNYGASPEFEFANTKRFPFGTLELNFTSSKGRIENVALYGDFFGKGDIGELCALLKGKKLEKEEIKNALCGTSVESYIMGCSAEDIISLFEF